MVNERISPPTPEAENQVMVAKAGGIEAAVAAMRTHPCQENVQHYDRWALVITVYSCARIGTHVFNSYYPDE